MRLWLVISFQLLFALLSSSWILLCRAYSYQWLQRMCVDRATESSNGLAIGRPSIDEHIILSWLVINFYPERLTSCLHILWKILPVLIFVLGHVVDAAEKCRTMVGWREDYNSYIPPLPWMVWMIAFFLSRALGLLFSGCLTCDLGTIIHFYIQNVSAAM